MNNEQARYPLMSEPQNKPSTSARNKGDRRLTWVAAIGVYWALSFVFPKLQTSLLFSHVGLYQSNIAGLRLSYFLAVLPLLGFAAPLLCSWQSQRLRRIAFWFCIFEACVSLLLFWTTMTMSDVLLLLRAVRFRILGVPIMPVYNVGGLFVYFTARAAIFLFAAVLISKAPAIPPRSVSEQ